MPRSLRSSLPPLARWLLGPMVLALCVLAWTVGEGGAAAASVQRGDAPHGPAAIARAAVTSKRLAGLGASLRALHRAADKTVARPKDASLRFIFSVNVVGVSVELELAEASGESAQQIKLARRIFDRERERVYSAWRAADAGPQVAAIVRLLDGLTIDAAKTSGARTTAEVNAFKKAHLAEIKYAGRRWLVDRELGRQGAVIISRGVRNPRLRSAIEQLYRYGAKTGDGGTADKLLDEVRAGCRGGACEHWIKAVERRRNLLNIRKQEPLSATERTITDELIGALTKAIRAAGGT